MNNTRGANIKRYDSNGNYLGQFGTEGSGTGQYFYSRGIVGTATRLYIPDSGNLRFVATDRSGNVQWTRPCGTRGSSFVLFLACTSAAVDASGNIYTAGVVDNAIYKFSPTGTLIYKRVYARGSGQGQLNQPYGVAVRGNLLYVSDMGNNRISVFDLNGAFQGTFWNRPAPGTASCASPWRSRSTLPGASTSARTRVSASRCGSSTEPADLGQYVVMIATIVSLTALIRRPTGTRNSGSDTSRPPRL